MKIEKAKAVALLVALDYINAVKWSDEKLGQKLSGLYDLSGEEASVEDPELQDVLEKVLEAGKAKKAVVVIADSKSSKSDGKKPDAKSDKKADAKSDKKADAKSDKKADAKSDKKADAKSDKKADAKSDKKAPGRKGVGVCAVIVDCYLKASEKKPITKAAILDILIEKFPDRDPAAMKSTVGGSSSWLITEKHLKVHKNDKGYWATSN